MPAGNGTGPMGMGPMTGRAAGYCAGYPAPGFMNPYGGRGFGAAYPAYGLPYQSAMAGPYPSYAPFMGRGLGMGRGRGGGWGMGMAWRRGWAGGAGWGRGRGFGRGRGWRW